MQPTAAQSFTRGSPSLSGGAYLHRRTNSRPYFGKHLKSGQNRYSETAFSIDSIFEEADKTRPAAGVRSRRRTDGWKKRVLITGGAGFVGSHPADELLEHGARGPQYPDSIQWLNNVERITHLEPKKHCAFYNAQRFKLNVTRADMVRAGYSPSVRLFEAAACGTPIIKRGEEILIVRSTEDMLEILREMPDSDARAIGERARERVLATHTAAHRAAELEGFIEETQYQHAENRSVWVTKE